MIGKGFMEEVNEGLISKGQVAFGFMEKSIQNIPERKNGMNASILLTLSRKGRASILVWLK